MTTDATDKGEERVIHESWFNLLKVCEIVPHCEIRLTIVNGIPTEVLEVIPKPMRLDQPDSISWLFQINQLLKAANIKRVAKKK